MKWTKCTTKLPKNGQDVWIFTTTHGVLEGYFGSFASEEVEDVFWIDEDDGFYLPINRVICWMPHFTSEPPSEPEPPKEDEMD